VILSPKDPHVLFGRMLGIYKVAETQYGTEMPDAA